ncbi:MAG: phosphotransferase [Gammaproteobacteria bacterium]|nr:phosphotransferase [Gammaproteobacteria bacterium]MBT8075340.1 phosphotransferase [Gammaproteobacteria bacterium]NNK97944.1 phosphotransferase [Xanthomonadales bacterium]
MESSAAKRPTNLDPRLDQARAWLTSLGVKLQSDFQDVAGDASFRRYFRADIEGRSHILMDAAPPGEDVRPFMDVNRRLRTAQLHAPKIVHADRRNGFLLLEDLGDELYRDLLDKNNVDELFPGLFDILETFALTVNTDDLPLFSVRKLRRDMDLFPEWYLGHHRTAIPRHRLDAVWDGFCDHIIDSALTQPQCFVHRDFHSCNLLRTAANEIGIIDFQDAVIGPVSYDFVSLIWDRYIHWPRPQIETWMETFRLKLGLEMEPEQWRRYCDLMGLQRNIKIVGIFARLYYRDGKSGYLEMIPRFYEYVTSTLRLYPEFAEVLSHMEHPECVP